jgi:hypothetical protein
VPKAAFSEMVAAPAGPVSPAGDAHEATNERYLHGLRTSDPDAAELAQARYSREEVNPLAPDDSPASSVNDRLNELGVGPHPLKPRSAPTTGASEDVISSGNLAEGKVWIRNSTNNSWTCTATSALKALKSLDAATLEALDAAKPGSHRDLVWKTLRTSAW